MDLKTLKAVDVVALGRGLSEITFNDETEKASLVTIKERLALLNGTFPMDEAVVGGITSVFTYSIFETLTVSTGLTHAAFTDLALPQGSTFLSIDHFGTSNYGITGRVVARNLDRSESVYFIKVAFEDHGKAMLDGEYESSKTIYGLMDDFVPKPIGVGRYQVPNPPTYFYLSYFVNMDVTVTPDPAEFTRRLAQLHQVSRSPTGKFGFHVRTCDGQVANTVDWQDSWANFFTRLLLGVCEKDLATNGPWIELERATEQVVDAVIPRLLGCLEAEGRVLKPSIIHGDLWEGNMGINLETGKSILFDAGSYYGHNEMELGIWRCEFTRVFRSKEFTTHYLHNYPAAEPAVEFDDRNRLYSLKGALNYSAGHPGTLLRRTAYNDMCYLCEKYAPIEGIDKYNPMFDPSVTGAVITPHVAES